MKSPQRFWRYQQCIPGPFLIIELLHIEEAALHLAKIHMFSSFLHDSLQNYCDSICTVRWWHTPRNEFRGFLGSAGYRRLCYQQQLHQADVLHCLLQWTMPRPRVYKSYAMDVPYRVKRPWFKMLTDALKSLRCWMPQDGQTQSRILRERSSFKKPQLEHVLLEGYQRSTLIISQPLIKASYSRILTNSEYTRSETFRPQMRFIPSRLRSSMQITEYLIVRSRASL